VGRPYGDHGAPPLIVKAATLLLYLLPVLPAQDEPATFRSGVQVVDLHISVIDKQGHLVTDLPRSAFRVFENGAEQSVRLFRREDIPVSMGIIIDNSASMRDKRAKVAAASLALVKASNPRDEVFIVDFSDDFFLDQPFTNDIRKLEAALGRIDAKGGTAMRDAIDLSINYVKKEGKKDKKVLLVITDGNDNMSQVSLEDLIPKAQRSGVLIYSIGLLTEETPKDAHAAKRALKALAEASGGLDYYPKELADVETITPQIANEIRNQYLIEYSPSNGTLDGTFRQIKVAVNSPGHPTVRTRNGYYATPEPIRR